MFPSPPLAHGVLLALLTAPAAPPEASTPVPVNARTSAPAQRRGGAPKRNEDPVLERIKIPAGPLEVPPGYIVVIGDLFMKNPKTAPFLVLVHGTRSSRGEFRKVAPLLNGMGYNCLAIDLRVGGRMDYIRNLTVPQLTQHGVEANVLATVTDIRHSLAYAREHYAEGPLLVLGSAASATLSMLVAGEQPELIDGLLLFSPPIGYFEQFEKPADWARSLAPKVKCPTLLTGLRSSESGLRAVFEALGTEKKTFFLPTGRGVHGAKALWPKEPQRAEYWGALTGFLEAHFPLPEAPEDGEQG